MRKLISYLSYVLRHKWFVFLECCKLGIPMRGIFHDLSKFRPSEFFPYMNYFGKDITKGRSKTGYYKPADTHDNNSEYAFFKHICRNQHHWQYYVMPIEKDEYRIIEIPLKYRKEMLADWLGAGKAQRSRGIVAWWEENNHKLMLGPQTRKWFENEIEKRKK